MDRYQGTNVSQERAVGFTVTNPGTMKAICSRLLRGWKSPQDISSEKDDDGVGRYLKIVGPAAGDLSDHKWFGSVFKGLGMIGEAEAKTKGLKR